MQSPEDLVASGGADHFIIALDRTGVSEVASPEPFASALASWRELEFVGPETESHLDLFTLEASGHLVAAFAAAVEHGCSACVAPLRASGEGSPESLMLTFWNRLATADCVLVVASVTEAAYVGQRAGLAEDVMPLRCVHYCDAYGVIIGMDDAARTLMGWTDQMVGTSMLQFEHPDDVVEGITQWAGLISVPGSAYVRRSRFRTIDGSYRWFTARCENQLDTKGRVEVEMIDVHEHVRSPPPVRVDTSIADALAENVPEGIVILDDEQFVVAFNNRFVELANAEIDSTTRRLNLKNNVGADALVRGVRRHMADPDHAVTREFGHDGAMFEMQRLPTGRPEDPSYLMVKVMSDGVDGRGLPKGLASPTLARVREVLALVADAPDGLSASEVAAECGISEVTARRYLAYLLEIGAAETSHRFGSRGRPRRAFKLLTSGPTDPEVLAAE